MLIGLNHRVASRSSSVLFLVLWLHMALELVTIISFHWEVEQCSQSNDGWVVEIAVLGDE